MSDPYVEYQNLKARHQKELVEWIHSTPANLAAFQEDTGYDTPEEYLDEYGYKFCIIAHIAQDLRHPDYETWRDEYIPYHFLEDRFH